MPRRVALIYSIFSSLLLSAHTWDCDKNNIAVVVKIF